MVVAETLRPLIFGIPIGVAASLGFNRILQSQLVGVSFYDPKTMIGSVVILVVASLAASYFPAREAMAVAPSVALGLE